MNFIKKIFLAVNDRTKRKILPLLGALKRKIKKPNFPNNRNGNVFIHLGCGMENDSRWINVDLLSMPHIHYIQDICNLSNFDDNSADLIYVCHALEHVSHRSLDKVLIEWKRVLRSGGILRLSVPDFEKMVNIYYAEEKSVKSILKPLMGGQDYKYNFHYSVFNEDFLKNLLKIAGFAEVRYWDPKTAPYHNFNDWSSALYSINGHNYPISLNLEAIK